MHSLFSPNSKFMIFMGRVGDLLMLNFYFLVTSIPIITIGASSTALYTACFRFNTEREKGTTRTFFTAFKDNFKQATMIWVPLLIAGLAMLANIYIFASQPGKLRYVALLFGVLLVLAFFIFLYAFPLQSQFENKPKQTVKNALVLSVAYLPRSLVIGVLYLLPWGLFLMDVLKFFQSAFLWVSLYFSTVAYFSAFLLKRVFAPYMPGEDEEDGDEDGEEDEEDNKTEEETT